MKIFLRIVGITSILLAWGITAFMSFTFSGANLNQLQRLSWNVLEMEIKNDFLDDRLYFTADAAVATPFWRHVSWAQKAMDRAESLNSSDFKLDEKLREGVLSTGAFDRQGSQKISSLLCLPN